MTTNHRHTNKQNRSNLRDRLCEEAKPIREWTKTRTLPKNRIEKLVKGEQRLARVYCPAQYRRPVNEATAQYEMIVWLRKKGFWVYKAKAVNLVGSADNGTLRLAQLDRGIPDLLCCSPEGRFLAVECKKPGAQISASPEQLRHIMAIREHNGHALISWGVPCLEMYMSVTDNLAGDVNAWPLIPKAKEWETFIATGAWPTVEKNKAQPLGYAPKCN